MGDSHSPQTGKLVILKDGRNFDGWEGWVRSECTIHDCWHIITGHEPRPLPHPKHKTAAKTADVGSSHGNDEQGKGDNSSEDEASSGNRKGKAKQAGHTVTSPSGVILDSVTQQFGDLSINEDLYNPEEEEDKINVLDQTLAFDGEVDKDASDEKRKKRKRKIKKWDKRARKALGIILHSLDPSLLPFIGTETNPRKVYLRLYRRYRPQTYGYQKDLFHQLHTCRMNLSESLHSYLDRITNLTAKLTAAGCPIAEQAIILFVLEGLIDDYSSVQSAINATTNQHGITLRWLTSVLIQEEATIKSRRAKSRAASTETSVALYADSNSQRATKGKGSNGQGANRSSNHGSKTAPLNCSHCFKTGHTAEKCWSLHGRPGKKSAPSAKPATAKANVAHVETASVAIIEDAHTSVTSQAGSRQSWLWDSGASASMTPDMSLLHDIRPLKQPTRVRLGDGRFIEAAGQGDLHSRIDIDGRELDLFFPDVLYVPGLGQNLLSSYVILNNGYHIRGNRNGFLVEQESSGAPLLIGQTQGKLTYVPLVVKAPPAQPGCPRPLRTEGIAMARSEPAVTSTDKASQGKPAPQDRAQDQGATTSASPSPSSAASGVPHDEITEQVQRVQLTMDEAHRRFGHISRDRLLRMVNMSSDVSIDASTTLSQCEACALAKSTRKPIGKGPVPRASAKGALLHADLVSVPTTSIGGKTGFLTIVDDHSRFRFHVPIRTKDEASDKLADILNTLPDSTQVKTIRSDCGGEFTGGPFHDVLRERGIKLETTPPYTPKYNGVAERSGRTAMEMVRAMLKDSGLPKSLWAEALNYATRLINYAPTKGNGGLPPFQVWEGKAPRLAHLRPFGAKAYAHIARHLHNKLADSAHVVNYVGPAGDSTCHRVWVPGTRVVTETHSLVFATDKASPNHTALATGSSPAADPVPDTISVPPEPRSCESGSSVSACHNLDHEGHDDAITTSSTGGLTGRALTDSLAPILRGEDLPPRDVLDLPLSHDGGSVGVKLFLFPSSEVSKDQSPRPTNTKAGKSTRSGRVVKPRTRLIEAMVAIGESTITPDSYQEALNSPDAMHWLKAASEEHESLKKTNTFRLVELPIGRKALGSKLIFKLKTRADGTPERYKARIVVQGFSQREGIDFTETYAPVVRYESLRFLLALAVLLDLEIHQMDVDSAFLQADLDDEVYVRQPEGFVDPDNPGKVWRLLKSLYGLKQAPMVWNQTIDAHLKENGLQPMDADPCVYIRWQEGRVAIIALYVDDIVVITHSNLLEETKGILSQRFPTKDMGEPTSILGMEIIRDRANGTLELRQSGHIASILSRANMTYCKPISTPMEANLHLETLSATPDECRDIPYRSIVGALLYVACATRWDIAYNVAYLCRFLNAYNETHWTAVKHLLRYLKGTRHHTILYSRDQMVGPASLVPVGYSDADWAGDKSDRKSISAYVFLLAGGPIAWSSRKQSTVSTSSCEAELYALSHATLQALYIRRYLEPLQISTATPITLYCDSQSALAVSEREQRRSFHSRLKHLNVRHLHIADNVEKGLIRPDYCPTKEMIADPLTKALPGTTLEAIKGLLGAEYVPPSLARRVLE
jgi:transposase InsO family protein